MLNQNQKIEYLQFYLAQKNNSYADTIKVEIAFLFFDLCQGDFNFLKKVRTQKELEKRIDFVVSKVVLHEHEEGIRQIIQEYL
ncbi:MAG: hypothetical protein ACPG5B_16475 [Chitinophagales bacterium]